MSKARGIWRMAVTWGVTMAVLSTALLAAGVTLGVIPSSIYGIPELVAVGVRWLVVGGAAGALFAWTLSRREQGKVVTSLTAGRVGLAGFVATAAVGALAMLSMPSAAQLLGAAGVAAGIAGLGLVGAGLSIGVLRIARRAPAPLLSANETRELPPG